MPLPTLLVSDTRIVARMEAVGPAVRARLLDTVTAMAIAMTADARARAAAHIHTLGGKPGLYLASIQGGVSTKVEERITGYVRSGSPLAHLLEWGATTPPHDILPKVAKVLAFEGGAGTVFARLVHSPGASIPPYPAIYPAFDAVSGDIKSTLAEVAKQAAAEV